MRLSQSWSVDHEEVSPAALQARLATPGRVASPNSRSMGTQQSRAQGAPWMARGAMQNATLHAPKGGTSMPRWPTYSAIRARQANTKQPAPTRRVAGRTRATDPSGT